MARPRRLSYQPPLDRNTLSQRNDLLSFWALFSISFTIRIFQINKLRTPILNEYKYIQQLINLSSHDPSRPIIGDLIIRTPIRFFTPPKYSAPNTNATLSEIFPSYRFVKVANVIISSFVPPLLAATLRLQGYPLFVSTVSGFLIVFEFCNILKARIICTDSLFNFFFALSIFLQAFKQFHISTGFTIICSIIIALSSVIDYSGFVLIAFIFVDYLFNKKKEYQYMFIFISTCFLVHLVDLGIESYFIQNLNFTELISNKFQTLFCFECRRYPVYIFPLWKFIPQIVWKAENQKICLMNHPIVTILSALFCTFGIFNRNSVYYFVSIYLIWFLKRPTNCSEYQVPFFFSVLAIAHFLRRFPMRNILSLIILLVLIFFFAFWAPWIYGLKLSPTLDATLDFWRK
ncbi:hypothetical protein TRFO_27454 [Tritrichomonas foetus]|uniref:ArnT-like N-terminal domain-containing protein n=1 Tax=Tritrichomonas foetus TaxID=1144522 RepID=A0A1J4K5K0_9EUKA|nr:hypothetical protein TRFO_27454 [Tritrichomonas foetus]|eukprot:OHT04950.1 hypothetical protein TRFO_27454 [Tritrichomonas foetus]